MATPPPRLFAPLKAPSMASTITLLLITLPLTFSLPTYSHHCPQLAPESTRSDSNPITSPHPQFLHLINAYLQNADQIIQSKTQLTADFFPRRVFQTLTPGVVNLNATMRIKARVSGKNLGDLGNSRFRIYGGTRGGVGSTIWWKLSGFWDSRSGRVCMVGSEPVRRFGDDRVDLAGGVVLRLNYPMNSTIESSLVTGSLEILDLEGKKSDRFRPIQVLGFAMSNYEHDGVEGVIESQSERNGCGKASNGSLSLDRNTDCFDVVKMSDAFELKNVSLNDEVLGRFMSMNMIGCYDHRMMRVVFRFSNASCVHNGYLQDFDPGRVIVADGTWNADLSGICFVGCRVLGFEGSVLNASIGDCSYRFSFVFPSALTIRSRSAIDGLLWTNKSVTETGYSDKIGISSYGLKPMGLSRVRYEYTEFERAGRYCTRKVVNDGKEYPDRYSSDLKFPVKVKNSKGHETPGHANPLFVDSQIIVLGSPAALPKKTRLLNVSYQITFTPLDEFKFGSLSFCKEELSISAEGILDLQTGLLCMVGCRKSFNISEPLDCEISVSVQFPAPNSNKGESIKGTIKSERDRKDPLYFEGLELSATSIPKHDVIEYIWRMDLEITMVLISSTLVCIFVVLQLFHVKKHPDVLPFISLVMLVSLTLDHMIPLLLNFKAIVSHRSRRDILFRNDAWLEVDEVLVRVITMVAFLLKCRLLQLAWLSRGSGESHKTAWIAEKKVICWFFPVFVGGALVACLLHPWGSTAQSRFFHRQIVSPWVDLKSYAGLVLDCFLLPQIMFNVFSDSKEKALSPPYYFGTTLVRLMPHLYDLFRAHSSVLKLDLWYIYVNPKLNYYSTSWDIVISCCGLLFAFVVFLQQRLGGRGILPRRLKERFAYEKVPVASSC
ncbi:hypothetical protein Droror1_Dr00010416 [Drosera rotundifolia]